MRIRYCSADVCSSDLVAPRGARRRVHDVNSGANPNILCLGVAFSIYSRPQGLAPRADRRRKDGPGMTGAVQAYPALVLNADFRPLSYFPLSLWSWQDAIKAVRSEEHTSELQSLMRISYAVFCLKKKNTQILHT